MSYHSYAALRSRRLHHQEDQTQHRRHPRRLSERKGREAEDGERERRRREVGAAELAVLGARVLEFV